MSESEMVILREVCKALDVSFEAIQTWPDEEAEESIRNDAVALGIIKKEDKYKRPVGMLHAEMNRLDSLGSSDLDMYLAPRYTVKLDIVEFEGEEIDAKPFKEYHAAKTYLEIKHGRYGDIDYVRL